MPKDRLNSIYGRRESQVRSYSRDFPVSFVKAKGAEIWDVDGMRYIDFLAGCSSLNYGHNDPDMKAALIAHLERDGLALGLDLHTDAKEAFLETFEALIFEPRGLDYKVMMTGPTGTNAVEAAMKLARKVTGRQTIIAFTNGYHGMTMGALAATGNTDKRSGAGAGVLGGIDRMPYEGALGPDIDSLSVIEAMLRNPSSGVDAPAAFLIEPVQGEGGLSAASPEFLRGLARLASEQGALMIADEIQCGCGRTGPFFAFERAGIVPDLVPLAKSLSGMGLPFAALLIKPEFDIWKPGEHNGTFRGNTHAFITARIALEKFWADDRLERASEVKSKILHDGLARIGDRIEGARLKGVGLMQGVDVGSGPLAAAICRRSFERGLVVETSGSYGEVIKVLAPLTIPETLLRDGLDILAHAAADVLAERAA
jgi:diaminobutyrate-2-oxoglutarate transaminase